MGLDAETPDGELEGEKNLLSGLGGLAVYGERGKNVSFYFAAETENI